MTISNWKNLRRAHNLHIKLQNILAAPKTRFLFVLFSFLFRFLVWLLNGSLLLDCPNIKLFIKCNETLLRYTIGYISIYLLHFLNISKNGLFYSVCLSVTLWGTFYWFCGLFPPNWDLPTIYSVVRRASIWRWWMMREAAKLRWPVGGRGAQRPFCVLLRQKRCSARYAGARSVAKGHLLDSVCLSFCAEHYNMLNVLWPSDSQPTRKKERRDWRRSGWRDYCRFRLTY